MAVYKITTSYRGINKTPKGEISKYRQFHVFRKGDLVDAEEYTPENVSGVTFSKGMMLVSSAFIVPSANMKLLEGEELKKEMELAGLEYQEESNHQDEDNVIKTDDMASDKAGLVENFTKVSKSQPNIGKGAVFGGLGGFAAGFLLKKNKWIATIIGIGVGVTAVMIYNNYANKKDEAK